jgi:S1-C subfamily serine protease
MGLPSWKHLGAGLLVLVISVWMLISAPAALAATAEMPRIKLPQQAVPTQPPVPSPAAPPSPAPDPPVQRQPAATLQRQPITQGSFVAAAVQRVGDAVVRLDTEKTITRQPMIDPLLDDPFFRRFFGDELMAPPREELLRGQGSGFVVDQSGIILTNSHVVNGADRVTVTLKDGRKLQGQVSGIDEVTDLAVVKVDAQNLPVAPLGNSDAISVGDWAIAVGNPLGLDNTVTLGIVSTLNRSSAQVGLSNKRLDFIQTDAAINPGNSGGPLLNDRGEVIGINTAIRADAMGIGFAIPINKAKELKDQLIRGEQIRHPYLGIQMSTFTVDMAQENNQDPNALLMLPEVNGVIVVRVLENTPAAKAGMRRYDVITAIDGSPIATAEQLQRVVDRSQLGQELKVVVHRGAQTLTLSMRTAELKANQ